MTMTKVPQRTLIVCADDYGISASVSAGIRELAAKGAISATGAMTGMPSWASEASALRVLADRLDGRLEVGLHITLTDQRPLGPMPVLAPQGRLPSVGALIKASLLGLLPQVEIVDEIERQLSAFEAYFGRSPDFVDGHQHVHVLPGVRALVMGLFHRRVDPARCWLRDCSEHMAARLLRGGGVKASVVSLLARGFTRQARERGIVTNRGFTGFYDPVSAPLPERMPALLRGVRHGSLLMLHPGHVDSVLEAVDSLIRPRQVEWDFLSDEAWPRLLAAKGLELSRRGSLFSH